LNTTGDSYDIHCLTPYWLYTDSSKFISYADSDFVTQGDTTFGDGLTVFEEYRGFLVEFMTKPYDTLFFERKHIRSIPFIKDLFVSLAPLNRYTIGFADTLPIPVHIIDYSRSTNQLGYTEGYNSDLGGVAPVVNAHHVAAKLPYHRWIYSSMYTIRYKATFAPVLQMIYGMRTWKVGDRRYYIKWPYGFSNFCIDDCLPAYLAYVSGTNVIDLWQQTGIFVNYLQSDLDQMLYKQGMTAAEIDSVKHAGVRKVLGHEIGHIAGIPPLEKFPTEFHYFLAKDDISIMTWGFSMMDSLGKGIPRTYDSQDTSFLRINFRNPFGNQ